jgi:hypothetical protein
MRSFGIFLVLVAAILVLAGCYTAVTHTYPHYRYGHMAGGDCARCHSDTSYAHDYRVSPYYDPYYSVYPHSYGYPFSYYYPFSFYLGWYWSYPCYPSYCWSPWYCCSSYCWGSRWGCGYYCYGPCGWYCDSQGCRLPGGESRYWDDRGRSSTGRKVEGLDRVSNEKIKAPQPTHPKTKARVRTNANPRYRPPTAPVRVRTKSNPRYRQPVPNRRWSYRPSRPARGVYRYSSPSRHGYRSSPRPSSTKRRR